MKMGVEPTPVMSCISVVGLPQTVVNIQHTESTIVTDLHRIKMCLVMLLEYPHCFIEDNIIPSPPQAKHLKQHI